MNFKSRMWTWSSHCGVNAHIPSVCHHVMAYIHFVVCVNYPVPHSQLCLYHVGCLEKYLWAKGFISWKKTPWSWLSTAHAKDSTIFKLVSITQLFSSQIYLAHFKKQDGTVSALASVRTRHKYYCTCTHLHRYTDKYIDKYPLSEKQLGINWIMTRSLLFAVQKISRNFCTLPPLIWDNLCIHTQQNWSIIGTGHYWQLTLQEGYYIMVTAYYHTPEWNCKCDSFIPAHHQS